MAKPDNDAVTLKHTERTVLVCDEKGLAKAIEKYDPFNDEVYWPLRNVVPYLGRMGVR